MHATAFRPVSDEALLFNPFRIFCSLCVPPVFQVFRTASLSFFSSFSRLRFDLITDPEIRKLAQETLARRSIFTPATLAFLDEAERDGGISFSDADAFISGALETFKWHSTASVSEAEYTRLLRVSRLGAFLSMAETTGGVALTSRLSVADIVSFPGPHINREPFSLNTNPLTLLWLMLELADLTPCTLEIDTVQESMISRG